MKVLFLSQIVPYPPHGGVLQRGYNLLRELGREARVHLLAFVHPDVLPTEAARRESQAALDAYAVWNKRVSTAALNRWLQEALDRHTPPAVSGRRIRIRHLEAELQVRLRRVLCR